MFAFQSRGRILDTSYSPSIVNGVLFHFVLYCNYPYHVHCNKFVRVPPKSWVSFVVDIVPKSKPPNFVCSAIREQQSLLDPTLNHRGHICRGEKMIFDSTNGSNTPIMVRGTLWTIRMEPLSNKIRFFQKNCCHQVVFNHHPNCEVFLCRHVVALK